MKSPASQRGVALAIVVWFIAGMALLVSGIVSASRVDTRMAQVHLFRAQAAAAGDGAIRLALAEQKAMKDSGQAGVQRLQQIAVGRYQVEVRMIPAGLLVNISAEDRQALTTLFAFTDAGTGLAPGRLAGAVVTYRDGRQGRRGRQFFSPEDLLRVPGFGRSDFDAVRDFIVIEELSDAVRPPGQSIQQRIGLIDAANRGDGTLLNGLVQHNADTLRVDALVTIGDKQWLRRRWVRLESSGYSELPWRVLRSEAPRPVVTEVAG